MSEVKKEIVKGYKGFDKDLKCNGFQYEIGKTFKHEGKIELCSRGFHFCENPLDVWNYYPPNNSIMAEVESGNNIEKQKDRDSKCVTDEITIKAKIDIKSFIILDVKGLFEFAKKKTTGYSAHSATTGYSAHSATTGENTIACALGKHSKAKSTRGNWIVLSEYDDNYNLLCVKSVKVDGKKIKAYTWYELKKGKFVEVK
jgi:hypothetical protein